MRVHNPNPRLVNIAGEDGRFIRIAPGGTVEIDDEKLVTGLLKAGELVAVNDGKAKATDDGAETAKGSAADSEADARAKAEAAAAGGGGKAGKGKE